MTQTVTEPLKWRTGAVAFVYEDTPIGTNVVKCNTPLRVFTAGATAGVARQRKIPSLVPMLSAAWEKSTCTYTYTLRLTMHAVANC